MRLTTVNKLAKPVLKDSLLISRATVLQYLPFEERCAGRLPCEVIGDSLYHYIQKRRKTLKMILIDVKSDGIITKR